MKKTSTETMVAAMRILAEDIQSDDGVANAAIAEAADRLEDLQAEVRRLRASNDSLRSIANSLEDQNADCFEQVAKAEQERDQMKARMIQVSELINTIHPGMASAAFTGMSIDRAIATHSAEVIERVASDLAFKARDEYRRVEYQSGYLAAVNDAFTAANQLRQQAKEVQQ